MYKQHNSPFLVDLSGKWVSEGSSCLDITGGFFVRGEGQVMFDKGLTGLLIISSTSL